MARLDDQCVQHLSAVDLHRFPVWVWDDAQTLHCPINDSSPDPDQYGGPFFIRAIFRTPSHKFDGYLVGFPTYYAFGLFVADRTLLFNLNLPDMAREELTELRRILDDQSFSLFPLNYVSDVRFKGAAPIAGEFSPQLP